MDSDEKWYFKDQNKYEKRQKKIAKKTDRSQFKKTDQDKKKEIAFEKTERHQLGRVVSISRDGIEVAPKDHPEKRIDCQPRGSLHHRERRLKNPLTVGDWVYFEEGENQQGIIDHIIERSSLLARADNITRKKQQLLAANVDYVLITGSCVEPLLRPALLDRYLIAAQKGGLNPVIVINKVDLLSQDEAEKKRFEDLKATYEKLEIPFFGVSAESKTGLDELERLIQNRTCVFSGQSGVGKSSLISLLTGEELETAKVAKHSHKGRHTTTSACLLPLRKGGWCIDTPGIKSFGIWELEESELAAYFPEIFSASKYCRFLNCTHQSEPDCAVKKAVEENEISLLRYQSYLSLCEELRNPYLRR